MYFLTAALSGMRRRLVTFLLTLFGGTAIITAAAALGLWSYWLQGQKEHVRAARSATVFVESAENPVVEDLLTKVMQLKGVESARLVTAQEFTAFLHQHFPDLQEALVGLGDDIIPRMLEVSFPVDLNSFAREETVQSIAKLPSVGRVEDGAARLGKALNSLNWLAFGSGVLAVGLWIVLLIVCLGYYQNILYTDAQEIQLIRSFGATKFSIFLPWLIESVIQSLITGLICIVILYFGRTYLAELYNQFFGTIGYEPFHLNLSNFLISAAGMVAMALAAHILAGLIALVRGRIV